MLKDFVDRAEKVQAAAKIAEADRERAWDDAEFRKTVDSRAVREKIARAGFYTRVLVQAPDMEKDFRSALRGIIKAADLVRESYRSGGPFHTSADGDALVMLKESADALAALLEGVQS